MATKHTQGSWTSRGTLGPHSNPSLKGPCVVEAANGYVIATMNGWQEKPWKQITPRVSGAADYDRGVAVDH